MAEQEPTAEQKATAVRPSEFHVSISTSYSKTVTVLVSLDDTVEELMDKLNAQDNCVSFEMGRLFFKNRQLESRQTLRHYGITPDSHLHYVQRLRGGGEAVLQGGMSSNLKMLTGFDNKPEASGSAKESWLNLGSLRRTNCWACKEQVFPEVAPTIIEDFSKHRTIYQAHLPGEGIFRCSITGLAFEVKSAVTITYRYATWTRHLSETDQQIWVPVGPLFRIEVQPGVVQAVFLPHFICLAECEFSRLCFIAHFKYGKMTLERPNTVIPFSAVLENPSFSLLGVLWRKLRSSLVSIPVHSLVLIFQQLTAANTTLHFYLIPDDKSVKQAIEKQEMDWNSKCIPKPPPLNPLFFGCTYRVAGTNSVEITPDERLPFCYKNPKEQQLFVEIYIRNMAEDTMISMTDTRNDVIVWKTLLRSGDINLRPHGCSTPSGAAFMKKHKTELCSRLMQLHPILLLLRDANVINDDEEDKVLGQDTTQRKNRVLLELVERKGLEAQEQLYHILQKKDPYLIADLEKSN